MIYPLLSSMRLDDSKIMLRHFWFVSVLLTVSSSLAQIAETTTPPPAKEAAPPAQAAPAAGLLTQDQAAALIKDTKDLVLLDVRTGEEFKTGCLAGATLIDFLGNDFAKQAAALDKTKPYLVYCALGGRSKRAAVKLRELGFTKVYDLSGGFNEWLKAGKPAANLPPAKE